MATKTVLGPSSSVHGTIRLTKRIYAIPRERSLVPAWRMDASGFRRGTHARLAIDNDVRKSWNFMLCSRPSERIGVSGGCISRRARSQGARRVKYRA